MNCELFQTMAADLARDEKRVLMDAGMRDGAQAHVADCERCTQTLLDQIALGEGLQGLSEHMKSWQAPGGLEAQVLASFRNQKRVGASTSQPQRRRHWALAAAAILLVVVGLLGMWVRRSQVTSGPEPLAVKDSKVVPPSRADVPKDEPDVVSPSVTPVQVSAPRNAVPRRSRNPNARLLARDLRATSPVASPAAPVIQVEIKEIATDFVAVGYGSALDLQDGGQLVRVELPRLTLARFGLPINMDSADETVTADVLLGADGLARAIRFVKQ